MRVFVTLLMFLVLLPPSFRIADAAEVPPALSHNPFSRPPSEVIRDIRPDPAGKGRINFVLELQATMIGSVNKLANVGGRILKPGDEVHGYVLVAIHEQYAVFRKNGEDTTVYVKPLAEDDE